MLNQVYADKSKVKGINLNDPSIKQQIYEQYLKAYKKGVFNYIKEDVNAAGSMIPRKYFSGGLRAGAAADPTETVDPAVLAKSLPDRAMVDFAILASTKPANPDARLTPLQRSIIHRINKANTPEVHNIADHYMANVDIRRAAQERIRELQRVDEAMTAKPYDNYEEMRKEAVKEGASGRYIRFIVTFSDNGVQKKALVSGSNITEVWADGLKVDEERGPTTPVRFLPTQFIQAQVQVVFDAAMVVSSTYVYHDYMQFLEEQASRVSETGGFFDIKIKKSPPIRLRVSDITENEITGLLVDQYNVVHPGQEDVIYRGEFEWAQEVDAAMMSLELGPGERVKIDRDKNAIVLVGGKNFKVLNGKGRASVWEGWDTHLGDVYPGHPYNYLIKGEIVAEVNSIDGELYVQNVSDAVIFYRISSTDMAMAASNFVDLIKDDLIFGNFDLNRYRKFYKEYHKETLTIEKVSLEPGDIVIKDIPSLKEILKNGYSIVGPLRTGKNVSISEGKADIFTFPDGRVIVFSGSGKGETRLTVKSQQNVVQPSALVSADKATLAQQPPGGIDLNTSNGMQWKVSKDGRGVEMNIDPAMIERIRREGIDSLSPVVLKMTPVASIWPLVGLQAPAS